ncbi:MAG: alpha-(1-_3)-arabinofuranosyltransferase domain-containing protein [Marmoricola sp.]
MRGIQRRLRPSRTALASLALYAAILVCAFAEQFGRTTTDTKAALVSDPSGWLRATFSLWNPGESLGDLQNQAYGYLFPMGPFFAGLHGLGIPLWAVERLWSVALIVLACEGARLVARQLGLMPWPAWLAGVVYALSPRMLSEIGVRSAEVVPTAVLPWALLPILLVLRGRISERTGALLSAAAFLFFGAVNGTATLAPLPLIVIVMVWGVRRGLATRRLLAWWVVLTAVASFWWVSALLHLQGYSPPFFDYVEDAKTTTSTAGFDPALRGMSYWVGYLTTGGHPTWPAAWALAFDGILVLVTGVVAIASIIGLARWRSPWRTPLLLSATLGLVCLTIGHTSTELLQSPVAPTVQRLLDHPFALLRNVTKIDPILRLPMAVGFGVAVQSLRDRAPSARRRRGRGVVLAGLIVALVCSAQPVFALNLRTAGWTSVPSYWTQAADWLARAPGPNSSWVVPGAGFAVQSWGATFDEPMSMVGRTPWVSRTQAPLVPAATLRLLDGLESTINTGVGSPNLDAMLARLGIGYVIVRHDLAPGAQQVSTSSQVSLALARSRGLRRVATFGPDVLGPRIEIYRVLAPEAPDGFVLTPDSGVVTVASDTTDVLAAVGQGLVAGLGATVLHGESGWSRPVQIVGDGDQRRIRQFGLSQFAEGAVLSPNEPTHSERSVQNYPASPEAKPVTARYVGIRYIDASSSQGYTAGFGPVLPEDAPFSAVDGDPRTSWRSAAYTAPVGQWLEIHLSKRRPLHTVQITSDAVRTWRIAAGGRVVSARTNPKTGVATADLAGASGDVVRLTATSVTRGTRQVAVSEVRMAGLPAQRSLVVPPMPTAAGVDYLFHATSETRPCVPTVLGPDCDPFRYRPAEEGLGIDRTITVTNAGQWALAGQVVVRTSLGPDQLITPASGPTLHASSTYFGDPTVSARMAYDGNAATSWIAAASDRSPTLDVTFPKARTIDRLVLEPPAPPAVAPTQATLISGRTRRVVALNGIGSFTPITVKHLRIVFSNPQAAASQPLGAAEIDLQPGTISAALRGARPGGVPCGRGPVVQVDGRPYPTRVSGVVGDVISGGPLAWALCGRPVNLSAGAHRIRVLSTDQFQPITAALSQPLAGGGPTRAIGRVTPRSLTVGPGVASVLSTTMNANRGWTATLNGHVLRAQTIDGWAQGWQIPAGRGGVVRLSFAPQTTYLVWLIVGLALAGALLLAGIVALLRLPGRMQIARPIGPARGSRRRGVSALIAPAAWVLAGLPGLVGALLALVLRRHWCIPVIALLAAGPIWTAIQVHVHGPTAVSTTANVLSGIGVVALLVSAVTARGDHE